MSAMDYYAFGGTMSSYINGNTVDKYKFTGKERDSETGLDYFGARYFDSKIGRWMSVDPRAELRPGLSPYNYCQNNPLLRIDPDGLTDIIIEVHRMRESNKSTQGVMFYYKNDSKTNTQTSLGRHLYTLELPWRDNKNNVSSIKEGEYSATREKHKEKGDVLRLEDKNNRKGVLVHTGNTSKDTQGCILVGETQGQDQVSSSKDAMTELTGAIDQVIEEDKANGEKTTITIRITSDYNKEENKSEEK